MRRFLVVVLVVGVAAAGLVGGSGSTRAGAEVGAGAAVRSDHEADFNGDGYADLAVKGSTRALSAERLVESVHVIYGSPHGLTASRNQYLTEDQFANPGLNTLMFAVALAAGDFDGNGFSDLAISDAEPVPAPEDPTEDAASPAGRVHVLRGSAAGLTLTGAQTWRQDSPGVLGASEDGDYFGMSLAAANFGRGAHDDLAVGVPGESGGVPAEHDEDQWTGRAGAVNVLYGSPTGLSAVGNQLWTQNTPGIAGTSEPDQDFGDELAAGHFAGRAYADLAIGVPGENRAAGAVNVIYGSAAGLTATGNQLWSQNTAGIPGRAEMEEYFGSALAAGNFSGTAYDALAIGAPGDSPGGVEDGGTVNVIYGSARGLAARGSQIWSQESRGLAGEAEDHDGFGVSLAAANLGHDRRGNRSGDLVIGVANESVSGKDAAGSIQVIYGSAGGLSAARSRAFHQDTRGVRGSAEHGDHFGYSLAAADFGREGHADLAIGVYGEHVGRRQLGGVSILYGSAAGASTAGDQFWTAATLSRPTYPNNCCAYIFGSAMTAR